MGEVFGGRNDASTMRLDVHELLGAGAEGGAPPLYALQALKLSNRATMVQRAQKDLFRTHSPDYKSREASAAEVAWRSAWRGQQAKGEELGGHHERL